MPKRTLRPIYSHNGYTLRPVKVLASGGELLHCTERKTMVQCGALGRRETDGSITISKPHAGYVADDGIAQSKLARLEMKGIANSSTIPPRDIFHEVRTKFGVRPVVMAGSSSSLNRMINRQRDEKCPDTDAVDSTNPAFQGKMTVDNDGEEFLLFDLVCPTSNSRHVGFASRLGLDVLEKSSLVLSDGTFDVAQPPFKQIWCILAQYGDSIIPVVHVLMASKSIADYDFVLEQIKNKIPHWYPSDYLGDLEIGQSRAFINAFPTIRSSFCYFHLTQAWFRKLRELKMDGLTGYGSGFEMAGFETLRFRNVAVSKRRGFEMTGFEMSGFETSRFRNVWFRDVAEPKWMSELHTQRQMADADVPGVANLTFGRFFV